MGTFAVPSDAKRAKVYFPASERGVRFCIATIHGCPCVTHETTGTITRNTVAVPSTYVFFFFEVTWVVAPAYSPRPPDNAAVSVHCVTSLSRSKQLFGLVGVSPIAR